MCPYAPVPYTDMLMCSLLADNQYIDYLDATDSHLVDWTILTKGVSRVVDSAIPLIRPEDVVLTPCRSTLCVVFQHIVMTNTFFLLCLFGFSVERQRQNVEQVYISEGLWKDAEWKRGMMTEPSVNRRRAE